MKKLILLLLLTFYSLTVTAQMSARITAEGLWMLQTQDDTSHGGDIQYFWEQELVVNFCNQIPIGQVNWLELSFGSNVWPFFNNLNSRLHFNQPLGESNFISSTGGHYKYYWSGHQLLLLEQGFGWRHEQLFRITATFGYDVINDGISPSLSFKFFFNQF